MPHPKHRFSQTRTAKRRTHDKVEPAQLATCSNCGAAVMYHHVCPECGYYRGKLAIEKGVENAVIDEELALKWLNAGAVPSETVKAMFNRKGINAKFVASKKESK